MRALAIGWIAMGCVAAIVLGFPAIAATETVLYSFNNPNGNPLGRLRFIGGSLYGSGAGEYLMHVDGEIFKLTEQGNSWKEKTLHVFDNNDGNSPFGTVVQDKNGALYGTTSGGDKYNGGNVFTLYKKGGKWVERTIWAFGGVSGDGMQPECDLVVDKSGNPYGTTFAGGTYNVGTVFELSKVNGVWTEAVLYSFPGSNGDGWFPYAGLLMAGPETFYGTTWFGGNAGGDGAVFRLLKSGGVWKEKVIYSFSGGDGNGPLGTLIRDKDGALYGTTEWGGAPDTGVALMLTPSGGKWTETVLHVFDWQKEAGFSPIAGLHWGPSGSLYGTTARGAGTVFELTQSAGVWTETILHQFGGNGDGGAPQGGIILDKTGALYGTTFGGGNYNYGEVWKITP